MPDIHADRVLILDFGAQYTQLIARRIREIGVYSEIYACDAPISEIKAFAPKAIVLSGGPESVYDAKGLEAPRELYSLGVPVLGICYGMQWITHTLGGKVEPAERREYGRAQLNIESGEGELASDLFTGVASSLRVWNSHGDHVMELPAGFRTVGRTENAVAAVEDPARKIYAVEFHPEVNHTEQGTEILRNFLFRVCKAEKKWSGAAFIEETVEAIRQKVGPTTRVICALSGGCWAARWSVRVTLVPLPASRMTIGIAAISASDRSPKKRSATTSR